MPARRAIASRSSSPPRRPIWIATRSRHHAASPEAVRIIPSACGGGFGGKLDLSVQPLIALAAWKLGRPVRCIYTRPESMAATHQAPSGAHRGELRLRCRGQADGLRFRRRFQYRRLCLLGPDRGQSRAGPCDRPLCRAASARWARAIYTNCPPAGAFRGFGVPQAAIAHEALMDELADKLRHRPAGIPPPQCAPRRRCDGDGPDACPAPASPSAWRRCGRTGRRRARKPPPSIASAGQLRRGVGIGCMWYGIGNTSMSNPSRMRVGPVAGRHADALQRRRRYRPGLQHHHDPDRGRRAGRAGCAVRRWSWATPTSRPMPARPRPRARPSSPAMRPRRAGEDLRQKILRLANVGRARRCRWTARLHGARRRRCVRAHRSRRDASAALLRRGPLRSADHAARCRRPGHPLRHLWLRRPDGGGRGRYRAGHGEGAADRRRP